MKLYQLFSLSRADTFSVVDADLGAVSGGGSGYGIIIPPLSSGGTVNLSSAGSSSNALTGIDNVGMDVMGLVESIYNDRNIIPGWQTHFFTDLIRY